MIRDTSLKAYQEITADLCDKQQAVIKAVVSFSRPVCNAELAAKLDWPINCITPRVKELRDRGILADAGKKPGPPAGRQVHHWRLLFTNETLF
jgi:hypothetical protein